MQDSATFYVSSIPTQEHLDPAYIALGKRPGTTDWYITMERCQAYDLGSFGLARDFQRQLQDGEAYGLENDGHLWHLAHTI